VQPEPERHFLTRLISTGNATIKINEWSEMHGKIMSAGVEWRGGVACIMKNARLIDSWQRGCSACNFASMWTLLVAIGLTLRR